MHRCDKPAGRFKVSLHIPYHPEPYRVQVVGHRDIYADVNGHQQLIELAPFVGTTEPYVGELCEHEISWLHGIPGKDWRPEYEWTIERLDGATGKKKA